MRTRLTQLLREIEKDPAAVVEAIGGAAAAQTIDMLDHDVADRPIVALIGTGLIAAGGLVTARHLLTAEAWVQIVLGVGPDGRHPLYARELALLKDMGAPLAWAEDGWELPPADLIIDALTDISAYNVGGTQSIKLPDESVNNLIQLANSSLAPVISLIAPAGLNPWTGEAAPLHVRADAIVEYPSK